MSGIGKYEKGIAAAMRHHLWNIHAKSQEYKQEEKSDFLQNNIVQSMCFVKSWGRQTLILNYLDR